MKVEKPVYKLEEVEFCQTHPVFIDGAWRAVRAPKTCAGKDLICVSNVSEDCYEQWLSAVGICGLNANKGVPILEQFYRSFPQCEITNTTILNEMSDRQKYSFYGSCSGSITDEGRVSF